jgi:hypothetical protein
VNGVATLAAQSVNEPLDGFAGSKSTTADKCGFQLDAAANTFREPAINGRQMGTTGNDATGIGNRNERFAVNVVNVNHVLFLVGMRKCSHVYVEAKQIFGLMLNQL